MGCGASAAAGAKYSDPADPTAARKPESAGQQATGAHSEGVPAPAGADEAQEQKGSAGLGSNFTTPSFERRAGWVDIERPPLDKKLQPEWCARWLVVRGRQLQVFRQDPARQRPASRGFFQKERALIEPVRTLSLPDSELKKLARSEISEGRANAFLLGPREGEDEDREAAIDAAFTAPTAMPRAAKKSKKAKPNPKGSKRGSDGGKAARTKRSSSTPQSKQPSKGGTAKKKARTRSGERPNSKPPRSGVAGGSILATASLIIDPGNASECLWWCRALFEAGTKVPTDVQTKIEDMYAKEQHQQSITRREVWRQHLVRISRYLPRCVVQRHTQEDDIAPMEEPKMEIYDAAVVQIHISGMTRLVDKLSSQQEQGHEQLQSLHSQLFSTVLQTVEEHGGDAMTMSGDAMVVMWGLARGWGRQDPEKMKRDTLRACQCVEQLRAQTGSRAASTKSSLWHGAKCKIRCAVSAGRLCGVWAGGYLDRRQFMLKGAPMLELRRAAALANDGDIILSPEAKRLCGEDLVVSTPVRSSAISDETGSAAEDQYLVLEEITLSHDGAKPAPIEKTEPLHKLTSNAKMIGGMEKLRAQEADLLSDLTRLQLEEAPEISVANISFLSKFDAVMKAIFKLRSLLKEKFLDELLVFLKSQGQADFDLIRRYEKARRFMLEVLTDEMMDEFKSTHWVDWDRWKDELHETKERDRERLSTLSVAEVDGSGSAGTEEVVEIEISKQEIYDHGTKELMLDSTLQAIEQTREDLLHQDYLHEIWQRPILDVMLEYIPDSVMPLVEGHRSSKIVEASVVCVQLPEQNFEKHQDDEDEFNRTTMTEIQTLVLCLQQLADKFGAHLREIVSIEQATIFGLIIERDAVQHHKKVALVTALAVRDCMTQMNFKPQIAVTSGTVFDQLVGDNGFTRCQHACMGAAVDAAVALLPNTALLPAEMGGVICDEASRNGALVSQAALSPDPAATVWTMALVFDVLGRITLLGRRFRIFVPRRYDQWASPYCLRHCSSPFSPQLSVGVIGRSKEVLQIREWLESAGDRRVVVLSDSGYGKTALASAVYDDLHHNGYVCFAGKSLCSKVNTPFHAFWEIMSAILVYAVEPGRTPRLETKNSHHLEESLKPKQTEQVPLDGLVNPLLQQGTKRTKECSVSPWWLHGKECGDMAILLSQVEKKLPENLRARLPLAKLLLPFHNIPETKVTQDLDGKTRADATHSFAVDVMKHILQTSERRVCIMVDDMQWLDYASVKLIRILMEKLPTIAWYFNCNRADVASSRLCTLLCKNPNTFSLHLGVLDAEYTMLLAERQCHEMGATFVEPESQEFFRTMPGIPLHTIHFTRSLFESEDIIVYGGYAKAGPRLTGPDREAIPTDIEEIVRGRLKLLPEELHHLLCLPSCLDDEVSFTAAEAALMSKKYFDLFDQETPFVSVLEQIDKLCKLGLLARLEPYKQALIFPQRLVRQVAYSALSSGQRVCLHQDIAQRLVSQYEQAKLCPRTELINLFENVCETPDESFCNSLDEKSIKEQSFHAGQRDTNHCAWIDGAPDDKASLIGCRCFVADRGFGTVTSASSGSTSAYIRLDAVGENESVEEKVPLDFGGNGSNSKYFDVTAVSVAADSAIRNAQTSYSDFVGPSPFFQLVANVQLRFLHDLERGAKEPILQDCVENLYSALMQMARAGALQNAAELVMDMLGSLTDTVKLFEGLPDRDTPERREQELDMIAIFHRNWLTEDVSELFHGIKPAHISRMRFLANTLGESTHVYPIAVAEWMMEYYAPRRCLHTCIRLAREFLNAASNEVDQPDDALLLEAYRMLWMVHADKGEWAESIRLCTKVVHLDADVATLYSAAEYHESTFRYAGTDPGVSAWSVLTTAYLKTGELNRAIKCMQEMLTLAKELAHPLSLAEAFSTQLMLQFELKMWSDVQTTRAEVEELQVLCDLPMLSMTIKCAAAETNPLIARSMYNDIMQCTKLELQRGSWATHQKFIGPILRSCQLVGEYGQGLAIATEIWMQSEIAVGRFQGETWCAWVPDLYLYLGQFKLTEAEQEQHEEMPPVERATWREEVWAEGLKFLAHAVVASRFTGAVFAEFRALLHLYQALETTKIAGALKPRKWMSDLDPTILNIAIISDKLQMLYTQLDGDGLVESIEDFKTVDTLLQRLKSEHEVAKLRTGRRAMLKMATHQALDKKREIEEANQKRKIRAKAMWKQGKASAAMEATEKERQVLQQQYEHRAAVAQTLLGQFKQATTQLEIAESATLVAGWVYREKNSKFGDFVAAYASIGSGSLTWLKAADPEKPTGSADLRGCAVHAVAKRRRKHPTAFEILIQPAETQEPPLEPATTSEQEKFVIVPKDPDDTESWMCCIERNSLYTLEVVPLQEAAQAAKEAYAVARKEATKAKKAVKDHREESFAKAAFRNFRLVQDLAEKPEPEPEPEPEPDPEVKEPVAPVPRQVTLHGAINLSDVEIDGNRNPYGLVSWNGVEIGRTGVAQNAVAPTWDAAFVFVVPEEGGLLKVEVYNFRQGATHEFLGQVELSLKKSQGDSPEDVGQLVPFILPTHEYPLKPSHRHPGQSVHGAMTITVAEEEEEEPEDVLVGTLLVDVISARGLPKMDSFSHTDAYAQLEVEYTVSATKVIRDSESPVWNEEFRFDLRHRDSVASLRLFDHDPVDADDPIGEVIVNLAQLQPGRSEGWFPVAEVAGGPRGILGEINLGFTYDSLVELAEVVESDAGEFSARGILVVVVVEAIGLHGGSLFDKADVFVAAHIAHQTQRTQTINNAGSHAKWQGGRGEELIYTDVVLGQSPILSLKVWDEDIGSADDLLGVGSVDLSGMKATEWMETVVDLSGNDQDTNCGQLKLVVEWRPEN